jgi:F-type H+-transporting ATPase subunit a
MKQLIRFILLSLLFIAGVTVTVKADTAEENRIDLIGKVVDHHYLDFKPLATIELPRLIYDEGRIYFHRSTTSLLNTSDRFTDIAYIDSSPVVENGKIKPATYHIVRTDGTPADFDFSITSHLVFFWIAALLTLFIFLPLSGKYQKGTGRQSEPKGAFQNMFETLVIFIRDEIALQNIGHAEIPEISHLTC